MIIFLLLLIVAILLFGGAAVRGAIGGFLMLILAVVGLSYLIIEFGVGGLFIALGVIVVGGIWSDWYVKNHNIPKQ